MKILVLVKQVPDMEKVKFDREKGVIDRKSAGVEVNPFDLNALETAVEIKEKTGGEIIAISMGPDKAADALKEAISRGADEGILLSDRKFGGADVKATAKTLVAGIKKSGDFDLIIAGIQTVDGDTGQVGPEIAEMLDIPHISYVENIHEIDEEKIQAACNLWGGTYLKEGGYPLLITVTKDINIPRIPSFKDKMKARKAEIVKWGLEDLKEFMEETDTGLKGSATKVKRIEVPKEHKREGQVYRDDINKDFNVIYSELIQNRVLEGSI